MRSIYLSLGSNIGNKLDYLQRAIAALRAIPVDVIAESKYYRTAPVGYHDQADFVNMAVKIQTELDPIVLLEHIHRIEQQLNRKRIIHWGPRTIDIDIIWIECQSIDVEGLTVPHPRAFERAFVVVPMLDLPIDDASFVLRLQAAQHHTRNQAISVYDMTIKALNPSHRTTIDVAGKTIGGERPIIIAGPCAVESAEHIDFIAKHLAMLGVDVLRGGVFKPRTSPYAFQGLAYEGLGYISQASKKYNIPFITEVMDIATLDRVAAHSDIIQIGARNMYNYPLLKAVGTIKKPVLLKRNFAATIKEWVMAAEYIAAAGNDQIILCERGIRSFDTYTRNTLDLAAVPIMQAETGLPVIVDPSHGTGRRELIAPMSRAAIAAGADGLMIEVHPDPDRALSDGAQSLKLNTFEALLSAISGGVR